MPRRSFSVFDNGCSFFHRELRFTRLLRVLIGFLLRHYNESSNTDVWKAKFDMKLKFYWCPLKMHSLSSCIRNRSTDRLQLEGIDCIWRFRCAWEICRIIPFRRINTSIYRWTCEGDFHQPNLLVNDDFEIIAVLDWEWSCVLPIQVACLPPLSLSSLKMEELALGNHHDEFFKVAGIFLDRLGDRECSIFGERTMFKMLKEIMSNGGYWFGQVIHATSSICFGRSSFRFPTEWANRTQLIMFSILQNISLRRKQFKGNWKKMRNIWINCKTLKVISLCTVLN